MCLFHNCQAPLNHEKRNLRVFGEVSEKSRSATPKNASRNKVGGWRMQENKLFCSRVDIRASENFRGCLPQYPPKNLGQILAALAISGIFERFSPGQSGSEVGGPGGLFIYMGPPTSEPLWPGENLSKMPEIARAARIWPKFFGGY